MGAAIALGLMIGAICAIVWVFYSEHMKIKVEQHAIELKHAEFMYYEGTCQTCGCKIPQGTGFTQLSDYYNFARKESNITVDQIKQWCVNCEVASSQLEGCTNK